MQQNYTQCSVRIGNKICNFITYTIARSEAVVGTLCSHSKCLQFCVRRTSQRSKCTLLLLFNRACTRNGVVCASFDDYDDAAMIIMVLLLVVPFEQME